jgi:hypothetical protein
MKKLDDPCKQAIKVQKALKQRTKDKKRGK